MSREVLQKILARAGVASRRKSEDLIKAGRVAVDGITATPGQRVDPNTQSITVDGTPISLPAKLHYLILNKPRGYLTSRADPHHTRFVYDLLPAELRRALFTVGRLDCESEGLLLLTSDGDLAHRLMHPRYEVLRVYHVAVVGPRSAVHALRHGAELADGSAYPERVTVLAESAEGLVLELGLREGRKREVRRLCAAAGLEVRRLCRVAYGPVHLGDLAPGQWRRLTQDEVRTLRRTVGLSDSS